MPDAYDRWQPSITAPLAGGFTITPDDNADLAIWTRQIRVPDNGTSGNIAVVWANGAETTERVAAGEVYDWRIRRVKATGTTATPIRGYY